MPEGFEGFVIPPPPGSRVQRAVVAATEIGSVKARIEAEVYERAYQPVPDARVWQCTCQRCPKVWFTVQQFRPKQCPQCRSPWWDRPKTINTSPKVEKEPAERKRRKSIKGGKRGRPRKDAVRVVEAGGNAGGPMVPAVELPEIPVELLGAVGGPGDLPGGGVGDSVPARDEEAFPVPTPFSGGVPFSDWVAEGVDQVVETGQSVDGGGSEIAAVEELPVGYPDDDEDWWR